MTEPVPKLLYNFFLERERQRDKKRERGSEIKKRYKKKKTHGWRDRDR
jgi:hypothetical protein